MKDFFKKNIWLWISILTTIAILGIVFACSSIYPFGKNIFNLLDFNDGYVPVYYKLWDILHGEGSILFDWNLGAGLNCFGSLVMNSLMFPSSLLIFLFHRSMIPYATSYILLFKLVTIVIIFYLVVDRLFPKLNGVYKYIFSMMYLFSGWGYLMMSNILYLDAVSLFPIFVLGFYGLLKDGKWKLYVLSLTLILIFNYYMAYQVLFFIIGTTIISLLTLDLKMKKKKAVLVVLLTLISLFMSCAVILPSIYQSMSSYRMNSDVYGVGDGLAEFYNKVIYLFTLGIPFVLSVKQLFVKKDKKFNIFYGILLLYLLIPVFVEPINALWHTGSHSGFPFRFSFIVNFVLISGSLYYLDKNYKNKNKFSIGSILINTIIIGLFILFTFTFKSTITASNLADGVDNVSQVICSAILFLIVCFSTFYLFKLDKKYFNIYLVVLGLINSLCFGLLYFKILDDYGMGYTSVKSQEVLDKFKLPDDNYNYVDVHNILNVNFPYILKRPAMNNRLHIIKSNELIFNDTFNYGYMDTYIYSYGGTMFTNALLQNKYYISAGEMNDTFYNLLESHDGVNLYESKYNFNYIVPYNGEIFDEDSGSYLINNNNVYKRLFDKDEDIIHILDIKKEDDNYSFEVIPDRTYYAVFKIVSDVEEGRVFSLADYDLKSEIMYVKSSEGEIHITFRVDKKQTLKMNKEEYNLVGIEVGYIDDKEYIEFMEGQNDLDVKISIKNNTKTYKFNIEEDSDILIPVNYDDQMKVYVNGKEVDYKCNVINMISIKVNKGENEVVLKYVPKYIKEGIYISIISLVVLIVVSLTNKKLHYLDHKFILYPLFVITCILGILFVIKVYILSWL